MISSFGSSDWVVSSSVRSLTGLICNESNEFCLIKDLNNQLSKNYFDCQKNKVYQVWHYNNKDYSRNDPFYN